MTTTVAAIDTAAVEAFAGRVLTDFAGAAGTAMTIIGDRLGLYRALTGAGPTTAAELAQRTRLHHRLVTEWLGAQTVSGYVRHDPLTNTYELPVEHAMALSVVASPAYVIGAAEVIAGQYFTLEHLETAFRGDGGVDYHRFPDTVTHGIERFFRTAYAHQLAQEWFPTVDGLIDRLDDGVRVADVGCGHGAATLLMARTWPRSTFTGVRPRRTRGDGGPIPSRRHIHRPSGGQHRQPDRPHRLRHLHLDVHAHITGPAGRLRNGHLRRPGPAAAAADRSRARQRPTCRRHRP
jgi:hypothetical protein